MRFSKYGVLSILLGMCVACNGTTHSPTTMASTSTLTPNSVPSATARPLTTAEYVQSQIPQCEGLQLLDQPIKFAWPNVERRIKDLEGSTWGYFSCSQPQKVVSAFYREQIRQPPYNREETNWLDRSEGALGIYFHGAAQNWLYMWIVPQSDDAQKSSVIVAITSIEAFEPLCLRPMEQRKLS